MTASICSDAVICFYRSFRSAAGMSFDRLSRARSVSSVGSAFFLPDLAFPWISGTGGWSFLGCVWVRSGRFMPCFAMVHHLGVSMGGSAFDIPAAAASAEHLSVPIPQLFCRGAVPKCPYLPFHRLPHFLKFVLCHDVAAEACLLGQSQEFGRGIFAQNPGQFFQLFEIFQQPVIGISAGTVPDPPSQKHPASEKLD